MKQNYPKKHIYYFLLTITVVVLAYLLLRHSAIVGEGIKTGLLISANVIVPSLFPFMALTSFISYSGVSDTLSKPLAPLTKHLFHLEQSLGYVVVMSFIGGYPAGAKMLSILYEQKKISAQTAQHMLWFCCNAGPSFIITAVGVGIFHSLQIGLVFYVAQVLASCIIGFLVSRRIPLSGKIEKHTGTKSLSSAFVDSVCNATSSILTMCGFVTLFCAINRLLVQLGVYDRISFLLSSLSGSDLGTVVSTLLTGMLEVTSGCIAAGTLTGNVRFLVTGFLISFCSISVIFQVMSMLRGVKISLGVFVLSRVSNGLLTSIIAFFILKLLPLVVDASLSLTPPIPIQNTNTPFMVMCLLGMCCILILTVKNNLFRSRKL